MFSLKNHRKFSTYLNTLYKNAKNNKTPFFICHSNQIHIIEDPLEYYTAIIKGIKTSNQRIALSALYLGTGTLQRYLLRALKQQNQKIPQLKTTMIFDYSRSFRKEHGQSGMQILSDYYTSLKSQNIHVAFYKNHNLPPKFMGVLGQILGVHHQKICVFDDNVIIGGANLSQNYFLNRIDRNMKFQNVPQMADYLFDYLQILAQNSYLFQGNHHQPFKSKTNNLKMHYKLWKFGNTPQQFSQTIAQQQEKMTKIKRQRQIQQGIKYEEQQKIKFSKSKNIQLAQLLGTSIQIKKQLLQQEKIKKKEEVRQNLFRQHRDATIGSYLSQIDFDEPKSNLTKKGQKVYIFPFMTNKQFDENQFKIFENIIDHAIEKQDQIKISSGYLNFPSDLVDRLSKSKKPVSIMCSSPQSNSFFRGGNIKKYIPGYYRCFEAYILEKYGQKFSIYQFIKNDWSFHAKGVWIKQNESSYTTIIGSSNFNKRSRQRDTQLQFYLHSTCPQFNDRLDKQYNKKMQGSKRVLLKDMYQDDETKCKGFIRFFANLFSRFL